MGLNVSHGCFDGAYSAFSRFRQRIAEACGGSHPPHDPGYRLSDGSTPNPDWWYIDDDIVPEDHFETCVLFLAHSDCDGVFTPNEARGVAAFLRWVAPRMSGTPTDGHLTRVGATMDAPAIKFAEGCELAAERGENVEFW